MENQNNTFTGLEVIYQFPFCKLIVNDKEAREMNFGKGNKWGEVEGWGKVYLPKTDSMTQLVSLEAYLDYYHQFVEKYGEEPIIQINPNGDWFSKIEVLNEKFLDAKKRAKEGIASFYKELNHKGD